MADQTRNIPPSSTYTSLVTTYGQLLTPNDIAEIFRYASEEAVIKAHLRGALPVPLGKFRGRRSWFVPAAIVAEKLDELECQLREASR